MDYVMCRRGGMFRTHAGAGSRAAAAPHGRRPRGGCGSPPFGCEATAPRSGAAPAVHMDCSWTQVICLPANAMPSSLPHTQRPAPPCPIAHPAPPSPCAAAPGNLRHPQLPLLLPNLIQHHVSQRALVVAVRPWGQEGSKGSLILWRHLNLILPLIGTAAAVCIRGGGRRWNEACWVAMCGNSRRPASRRAGR